MCRSLWKSYFCDINLLKIVYFIVKNNLQKKIVIDVWSRSSTILPYFLGLTFRIHNGTKFHYLTIKQEMFFCKFGEFSYTKRIGMSIHDIKKSKKNKKLLSKKK
jgi:small subunit ribosomal protein S19